MIFFFTFSGKMKKKKQEKCIILMYSLYVSINKHNADIDFFVHAKYQFFFFQNVFMIFFFYIFRKNEKKNRKNV